MNDAAPDDVPDSSPVLDPEPDSTAAQVVDIDHRRRRGAAVGLVATLVALGGAELAAATNRGLRSPVVDVGSRFIDATPAWLKRFAISTFGTHDKQALLSGILVFLIVYAIVIGIVSTRRRRLGVAGVILFGIIGILAATTASSASPHWWSIVPTVVGTLLGSAAMWYLAGVAVRPGAAGDGAVRVAKPDEPTGRRGFLAASAGLGIAAVVAGGAGRWLSKRFDVAAARAKIVLPRARKPLAAIPGDVSFDVAGLTRFVTPNPDFYRIDTALLVPQVPVDTWKLTITGMVEHRLEFSFDDLLGRELVESDITLTCVSNEVGGNLAGNARWLGVPLVQLLQEAGVKRGADQIVGRSVDGFTAGFPTEAAFDGRGALVAIGMNGEPLPVVHGFPARLIVPGLYGYVSATKWLTQIELTTFSRFGAYWSQRGWSDHAPIKTLSRIDTPGALARIPAGRHPIAGVAWAQLRGIDKVEVRVDQGPWQTARLAKELNTTTWRQWMLPFDFDSGSHTIECRATDRTGAIQTEARAEPMPDGATGWHSLVVLVS